MSKFKVIFVTAGVEIETEAKSDEYLLDAGAAALPVITAQPLSQSVAEGTPVTFSVTAPGKPKEVSFVCRSKPTADYTDLQAVLPPDQE